MAYSIASNTIISDARTGSFANVTIQNNGFLEVNSSDGFQGTVAGYTSGGAAGGNPQPTDIIDKFPFATDTNATDVGDLYRPRQLTAGQSSITHGYSSGGSSTDGPITPGVSNMIQKFPFAVDTNSSDVGDLSQLRASSGGQSSTNHGYTSGGFPDGAIVVNTIDKFPFATDTNATDVGDVFDPIRSGASQSSTTHGYNSGGTTSFPAPPGIKNIIEKFPFATDTNASDVGDLSQARLGGSGQSSTTSGYNSGGQIPPANPIVAVNTIDKFPFSSDTNGTDIGDLSQSRLYSAGQSSTTFGYVSGGLTPSESNVIDKFPFSSDTNATDVGDLNSTRSSTTGQQD